MSLHAHYIPIAGGFQPAVVDRGVVPSKVLWYGRVERTREKAQQMADRQRRRFMAAQAVKA